METAKNITEFSKGKETKQLEGIDVQKFNKHLTSQTIEDVDKQETPSITWKDIKALKRSKYFKIKDAPKDWLFEFQILTGERI